MNEKRKLMIKNLKLPPEYKKEVIERNFKKIMETMDLDLTNDSLKETPKRVAKMYVTELFEGLFKPEPRFTTFNNFEKYDQIITNSATIFSTCEHHFVPIKMRIHIGYVPNKIACGISKLIRVAEWYAHRPQVQERLTQQIANYLQEKLKPKGVMVVIEGEHMCEQMRGIKKVDSVMRTSAIKGVFKKKEPRDEFMALIRK